MEPTLLHRNIPGFLPLYDVNLSCKQSLSSGQLDQHVSPHPHPDIEWDPSFTTHCDRVKRLAILGASVSQTLPQGFPASIQSPRVWSGSDFDDESKFIYLLSVADKDEINVAVQTFMGMCMSPTKHCLPTYGICSEPKAPVESRG